MGVSDRHIRRVCPLSVHWVGKWKERRGCTQDERIREGYIGCMVHCRAAVCARGESLSFEYSPTHEELSQQHFSRISM